MAKDSKIKTAIEKTFPVKVRNVETKRKVIFHLSDFIDDENFDNFSKIDVVEDFIKRNYKNSIVSFKGRRIEVEEL